MGKWDLFEAYRKAGNQTTEHAREDWRERWLKERARVIFQKFPNHYDCQNKFSLSKAFILMN